MTGPRARAAAEVGATVVVAVLAVALTVRLGLQGRGLTDWTVESRPSVDALLAGHVSSFFRLAPPYGASLLLRAPFMALTRIWGGGAIAVYRAGALPCLGAEAALALWLSAQLRRRGAGLLARLVAVAVCLANPIAVDALQQGHPEELLGGVLCVASVLCAQRGRATWSGILLGLAVANQDWGILAVAPVLVALPKGRMRAMALSLATAGVLLLPFVLVAHGAFVGQTEAVALHSTSIFSPLQLWWFLGSPALDGARLGPNWLAGVGHTLPIALMVPLSLAFAVRTHGAPDRRRRDAMLLLALLLLLRCALDPWDVVYYPVPFLTAVLAWETTVAARLPRAALVASVTTWFVFQRGPYELGPWLDADATMFAAAALPAVFVLGRQLFGAAPTPQRRLVSTTSGRRSCATETVAIQTPPSTLS